MSGNSSRPDPLSSLWAYFAYELRRHREQRGLGQEQLGQALYTPRANISHYETMIRRPGAEFARQLDEYFGTDRHFQLLWEHARRQHLSDWLREYVAHEDRAIEIKVFQTFFIPGLLQIEPYARAALAAGEIKDPGDLVAARLARQAILHRDGPPPPILWVLLDEAAISRPFGGAAVMRDQLAHLLKVGELPDVTIQIVPASTGYHEGMTGGFQILTLDDGEIAYAEAQLGGRLIEGEAELRRLRRRYDKIRSRALPVDSSHRMIASAMEALQ
ncbi:helix-turn-helix domain-containing protein [Actinomadura alba]|uniref:Helix-turn-helix transcriptional regulator n=1 Tax=Actinomadura alba TaxID=406431 RepID=A0ABR7LNU2_9ACTN|nr:helix-turn-helix transcriptional regulator [Actinomadura alba]MBC6466520.1 helix-turn-helix transcriptional regulator [Actinomadura alba]